MRRVAVVLAVAVVFVAGCGRSPSSPSGVTAGAAPGLAAPSSVEMKAVDVPFSGAVTGTLQFDAANPQGCAPSPVTAGIGATGMSDATGTASHMGEVTYHTEQCLIPHPGQPTEIVGKMLVLTAANGDEIHGTFTGQSAQDPVLKLPVVHATFTFKGGTGRFENATGTAQMMAVLTPASAAYSYTGRWEWTGTIRY
jgi:hypothetical protein